MSLTESTGIDARILTNLRRELADLERQAAETLADALRNAPALPPEVLAAIETSGVRVNSYGPEGTAVELVARCEVPMASPPPPQWPKDAYYPTRSVTDAWPPLGTYPREALVSPWLAVARREAPAMAETLAGELELLVRLLVPEKLRSAIIARDVLTDGWDWPVIEYPGEARRGAGWWALWGLRELAANLEVVQPRRQRAPGDVCILGRDRSPMIAPDEVAYADAVKWAQPQLSRLFGDQATRLLEARRTLIANRSDGGSPVWIAPYHLGLLFQAVREVEADRRKPAIAVDSGRLHHSLLAEMRDVPKDIRRSIDFDHVGHRVELLAPGKCVQLTLELGDTPSERLAKVLREWRGWKGLRNWIALQRLFSVEGGREGFVRWTVDAHLEALGYSPRERSRLKLRDTVAGEVETFTKIELSVRDKQGRERERRPLVLVGSKYDKLVGSRWHLDGMEFQINPLLYRQLASGAHRPRQGGPHAQPVHLGAGLSSADPVAPRAERRS